MQRARALRAHRFLTRTGPLTWVVPKFTVNRFCSRFTDDGPAGRLSAFCNHPCVHDWAEPPHVSVSRALFLCLLAATAHRVDCGPQRVGKGGTGTALATCTAAAERLGARRGATRRPPGSLSLTALPSVRVARAGGAAPKPDPRTAASVVPCGRATSGTSPPPLIASTVGFAAPAHDAAALVVGRAGVVWVGTLHCSGALSSACTPRRRSVAASGGEWGDRASHGAHLVVCRPSSGGIGLFVSVCLDSGAATPVCSPQPPVALLHRPSVGWVTVTTPRPWWWCHPDGRRV